MADSKAAPNATPKPAEAAAPTPQKSSSCGGTCGVIVITAIITFILTAVVVGGGVYLWQKAVCVVEKDDAAKKGTTTKVSDDSSTTIDDAETSYDMTVEGTSPTDNAENFFLATLGTLPGSVIDYDLAKTYMSASERAKFTDDSYIPLFYGIQEGPDTYEMKTQTINGNDATVKVDVLYGEMMEAWAFTLIWEDSAWKIDGFRNDAQ